LDEVTLFLNQVVADLPPAQQAMLNRARRGDAALDGTRLLVVEDDVRNVFALMSLLEPRGAKVQVARNGLEALAALEGSLQPDGAPIDLVLMDIMMPEMDGLTAMREIRKRPEWRNLPIIALTAKTDHMQALTAGANDYMAKPLDVDRLLSLVRIWIHQ
jgi:CheY-like chemotaxis protein